MEPSGEPPLVQVMYLFAGGRRHSDVASFLKKAESAGEIRLVLKEFDIERSPEHDLSDVSLWTQIFEALEAGPWFIIVSPPCNTFSRARFQWRHPGPHPLRTKEWPRGFPWLSNSDKQKVAEANFFVDKCLEACEHAAQFDGYFILEHPEDLGVVNEEHPGSIWQWSEVQDLIAKCRAHCFAIHQCKFGAITPKPTRILTNLEVSDKRCHFSMPKFDSLGFYKGPLPRKCGHRHSHTLIGKTGDRWNTSPSAAYPPQMCKFLADLILNAAASFGGGVGIKSKSRGTKRPVSGSENLESKSKKLCMTPGADLGVSSQAVQFVEDSDDEVVTASPQQANPTAVCSAVPQQADSTTVANDPHPEFDVKACLNAGQPIQVEWDNNSRGFVDGFGLCSPTRWRPSQRGAHRSSDMLKLADDTYKLLESCVRKCIPDVRKEAFKLVTGKLVESPFSGEALDLLRTQWAELLPDPADARVVDSGQPFYLRALAQWLKIFNDPDASWLVDEQDSFSTGVFIGVGQPLPRSPQVFPEQGKHRKLDDTEFAPIAENYPSAQISSAELEKNLEKKKPWGGCTLRNLESSRRSMGTSNVLPRWPPFPSQTARFVLCMTLPIQ